MNTINTTTTAAIPIPDYWITDLHDNEPWKRTIAELFIKIGQRVLAKDLGYQWFSMAQIAVFCRNYKLQWKGGNTRARDLELSAICYLEKSAVIMGCGVTVDYQTEMNVEKRRKELFLAFRTLQQPDDFTNPI